MEKENLDILENLEINLIKDNEVVVEESIKTNNEIEDFLEEPKESNIEVIENIDNTISNLEIEDKNNSKEEIVVDNIKVKKNNFLSGLVFLGKYIITSGLIFGVLLITTNYSAYINIAKSYIFKNAQTQETKGIINSVEASNIKEKYKEDLEKAEQENELEANQKVSEYSLKKLISDSNRKEMSFDIEITPYENRVVIPKIGKNVPLLDIKNQKVEGESHLNDIFMKELENGIIRYPGSAKPGNVGNSFIFGHSSNFPWIKGDYNDVFALLDNVEFDDEVYVYYGQKKYKYKIKEKKVIQPGDVSVLKRNKDKSELTLMTCWPIGTTLNRLIVTGELVK